MIGTLLSLIGAFSLMGVPTISEASERGMKNPSALSTADQAASAGSRSLSADDDALGTGPLQPKPAGVMPAGDLVPSAAGWPAVRPSGVGERHWTASSPDSRETSMPRLTLSADKKGFIMQPSAQAFKPWGFNYDRDDRGRLIEEFWETEWSEVEGDFAEMKRLGANVVRVHLQFGSFMDGPQRPNSSSLDRLRKLVRLAEDQGLYLNLTGLGCYHKKDVPAWYDRLGEKDRWEAQAQFWAALAKACADSPAIFCYDLMNEPVVPQGRRPDGEWLGPAFAGKHYVQFITLDQKGRPRPEIARRWIEHLVAAIRNNDPHHLITLGLVDWSLDRPGLTSGFVPEKVVEPLDFVSVHLYPETGKQDEALRTLKGFRVGKPLVVEETFPLRCSPQELEEWMDRCGSDVAGWLSFYWGKPPEELRRSQLWQDRLLLDWLDRFEKRARSNRNEHNR